MPVVRWQPGGGLRYVGEYPIPAPLVSGTIPYTPTLQAGGIPWDYTDSNVPWRAGSTWSNDDYLLMMSRVPSGSTIVDLQSGTDFWGAVQNTLNAAGKRVLIRLPALDYPLTSFRLAGSSGLQTYAFGLYQGANLQGFVAPAGPAATSITMAANSMSAAQISDLQSYPGLGSASYTTPIGMASMRLDGPSAASPIFLGGLTFRAADQQNLNAVGDRVNAYVPQSAPHKGLSLFQGAYYVGTHNRFQAFAKAMTSLPPAETANISSQYGYGTWFNTEVDGRRAAALDPTRQRQCSTFLLNNEVFSRIENCWLHHSNVSRYAVNDENRLTAALSTRYEVVRTKANQITNTQNRIGDTGVTRRGYTNATPFGWESTQAYIYLEDLIVEQDNSFTDAQIAQHLQMTVVGGVTRAGGRQRVVRGVWRNSGWPTLNGYLCYRITASSWTSEGYGTTLNVTGDDGQRLAPHVYSTSLAWPPSAAYLAGNGLSPTTHYIVRQG